MKTSVTKFLTILILLALCLTGSASAAQAETCWTVFIPPDTFQTVCSGGSSGGGGDPPPPGACTPGTYQALILYVPAGDGVCEINNVLVDACTGEIMITSLVGFGPCPDAPPAAGSNPCLTFTITPAGIFCQSEWGLDWALEASVSFPETFLDIRPFPVTLVRWPSAVRNGGTPPTTGSGVLDYIPYGGGDEDDPEAGDWREVTLTLQLVPAAPVMYFTLPTIGTLALPEVGSIGPPTLFQFELPSHPAVGASVTASQAGLSDLDPEMPLFSGTAQSAYRLFWSLAYEEYKKDCRPGPDPDTGTFNCKTNGQAPEDDGHWENEWDAKSMGGEITPDLVAGLPPELAADMNGDGLPEAYWNNQVTVRRMDEANSVTNPQWQGSWSWGGVIYWAVREGQGQVGWP